MRLDNMRHLLTVARENINASETVDADTKLWTALNCVIDVLDELLARQITTSEDRL